MAQPVARKLQNLPKAPGVYFFKDSRNKIIYVGKAAVLKNRVRSYFHSSTSHRLADAKTHVMVGEIANVEWITTSSEIDALFLESELIKRYKPKFNIDLRDDKHYLYVRISMKDKYPAVTFVRRPLDDGATYFGPYVEGFALRKALRYLRRIFPYSTHGRLPKRVCLQYHLGLCPGVEEERISSQAYKQSLKKLAMFLKGRRTQLIKQLEQEMRRAAKAQQFEEAVKLRNQVHSLQGLAKQIVFGEQERFDVTRDQALNGLAKLLDLAGVPRRIEAYDISHIAGSDNVASMVVFQDGLPAKGEYRKFKMRLVGNDDFAHIQEVIMRRFSSQNLQKWPKPDLIVIDGGKAQLTAALAVLEERGLELPAVGLAKRQETIIRRIHDPKLLVKKFKEVKLPKNSQVLQLVQRIRDEAHRFAVTYHSLLRSQRQTASRLEQIPGIGPATRKRLIKHFGSLRAITRASRQDLSRVLGTNKARLLKQYL
ncbi:excinuclease ABC subunit UvrC [Candidatus Microgenomates bacterium]|nr:excinuclease ABC subunit UvrC [Candidatus Microgenomates bacterium]